MLSFPASVAAVVMAAVVVVFAVVASSSSSSSPSSSTRRASGAFATPSLLSSSRRAPQPRDSGSGSSGGTTATAETRRPPLLPRASKSRRGGGDDDDHDDEIAVVVDRRDFVIRAAAAAMLGVSAGGGLPPPASAYEKNFPSELDMSDADGQRMRTATRQQELMQQQQRPKSSAGEIAERVADGTLWGAALWLLSGSRSNPLVTPLANVLYDPEKEPWLRDRNEGLFSDAPLPLYAVLSVVFLASGFAVDAVLVNTALEGDRGVALQLAVVSLIGGGFFELGRIATGEKKQTRVESDRSDLLRVEFAQFARDRLIVPSMTTASSSDAAPVKNRSPKNCHRSEVVGAFRRYYAKYRRTNDDRDDGDDRNDENNLTDLEIEKLLRSWSETELPPGAVTITPAGFCTGLTINADADAFR